MTPAATTPAGRGTTKSRRSPRRVSGPVGGMTRAAAAAGAIPAPTFAPPARKRVAPPRRVSGPGRPRSARRSGTLGQRAIGVLRGLPDHSLLDRLLRGRVWVAVLGVMLVGIVAMQVEVLKLGASMGRNIERSSALQGTDEALRANVASLADDQRIEALAAKQGMVMPAPADVSFLAPASPATVGRAMAAIHAPAASSFLVSTAGSGAVVTAQSADSSAADGSASSSDATGSTDSSGSGAASSNSSVSSDSSASSDSSGTSSAPSATVAAAATGATSGTSSTIPAAGSSSTATP